jgi:hypothetical protein
MNQPPPQNTRFAGSCQSTRRPVLRGVRKIRRCCALARRESDFESVRKVNGAPCLSCLAMTVSVIPYVDAVLKHETLRVLRRLLRVSPHRTNSAVADSTPAQASGQQLPIEHVPAIVCGPLSEATRTLAKNLECNHQNLADASSPVGVFAKWFEFA